MSTTMRAIAVRPGVEGSIHTRDVPRPSIAYAADGQGVLVDVVRVGICGTDREIGDGVFGMAPEGDDVLVIGHECLGRVVEVRPGVADALAIGTFVVPTVRRAGDSPWDRIGMYDFTTDPPIECGINRRHGFLTESFVEDAAFLIPIPDVLGSVGVLLEPMSIAEKGLAQADEVQQRLRIWQPNRAAVVGAGTIGLLVALILRLRGVDVTVLSRRRAPYANSELVIRLGATYLSTEETDLATAGRDHGPFDLIFEASGHSPFVFDAAPILATNGVLVLSGVTAGERTVEVDANAFNQGLVLGNKVVLGTVNASRADFVRGAAEMLRAEDVYPGWLDGLLTTPVHGLDDAAAVLAALEKEDTIKAFVDVGA